ncbi:MAG: hypothetical protein ACOZHQ_09535 [Thermodesulfobacteriota bacterium]
MADGKIEAKGRNGWFVLADSEVIIGREAGLSSWVDFRSKVRTKQPPISFRGSRQDLADLFRRLADELEGVSHA